MPGGRTRSVSCQSRGKKPLAEQQHDGAHHYAGDVVLAAFFHPADQDAEHQTRHGVAMMSCARPPKMVAQKPDFCPPRMAASQKDHRHDGVDQQVGGRYQHLDRGDLPRGGGTAAAVLLLKAATMAYDAAGDRPIFLGSCRVVANPGFLNIRATAFKFGRMR